MCWGLRLNDQCWDGDIADNDVDEDGVLQSEGASSSIIGALFAPAPLSRESRQGPGTESESEMSMSHSFLLPQNKNQEKEILNKCNKWDI